MDPDAQTPATAMEKALRDWYYKQTAVGGIVLSVGTHEDKTDMVLRELKQQFKYARVRSEASGERQGSGNERLWVFVGVRLKVARVASA